MQNSALAKIGITVAVALAGVGFLVKSSIGSAQHYQMVDEQPLAGDPASWTGHEMKVHGWVKPGSITEKITGAETERSFVLQKGAKRIRVFGRGPKPDTFKDQSEVVATGHIVPAAQMAAMATRLGVTIEPEVGYVVDASDLMAKCPSKYDGAQSNRKIDTKFE